MRRESIGDRRHRHSEESDSQKPSLRVPLFFFPHSSALEVVHEEEPASEFRRLYSAPKSVRVSTASARTSQSLEVFTFVDFGAPTLHALT